MLDFTKMFEKEVHEPEYNKLFGDVQRQVAAPPTQPSPQQLTNLFPMSPEETELKAFEPSANFNEHKKWVEQWDTKFQQLVDTNNKLTNELLDLNQAIARHDQDQKAFFDDIMAMVKEVQERVSPPDAGWSFFKKKPKEMTAQDWDKFIDEIQSRLGKINPKIDHFLNGKIAGLIEECRLSLVNSTHAMTTLRFKHSKDQTDDQNNRRMERLSKVNALIVVTKNSLEALKTSVTEKQENLTDFKVVAVPTILNQLSNAISSSGDTKQFAVVLEGFANLKVS